MKTITNYYKTIRIKPSQWMQEDIQENNDKSLCYIEYAIKHLLNVKGIKELLVDIATIKKSGIKGEQMYHNAIMEFHAINFVRKVLKFNILDVESRSNKIHSPCRESSKGYQN